MKKRIIAMLLCAAIMLCILPVTAAAGEAVPFGNGLVPLAADAAQPQATTPVPTEKQAYDAMIAMKKDYPEGMSWTNDDFYAWKGGIYYGGYGCAGFAFLLSDAAFGDLPARMEYTVDITRVHVGDILRVNNDSHSVIILEVHDTYVVIAEGNYNRSIHWGRQLTAEQVAAADYYMTRYPEGTFEEKYIITFDANGGENAPAPMTKTKGVALTLPADEPSRALYRFCGWAESASASSPTYYPGGTFTKDKDTCLYAVWENAVKDIPDRYPGEYVVELAAGEMAYYRLNPAADGTYTFTSVGSLDTVGKLNDKNLSNLMFDDDGGENKNFFLQKELTGGTTYYLVMYLKDSTASGKFTLRVDYKKPTEPLTQTGSPAIPDHYVGVDISTLYLADYITGGTAPYRFEKTGGPDWVKVSQDGTVTGCPQTVGSNQTLEVLVSDQSDPCQTYCLTVSVGTTMKKPAEKIIIEQITAESDLNDCIKVGRPVKEPVISVSEGAPAVFKTDAGNGVWQVYNEARGAWEELQPETFTGGRCRFACRIVISGSQATVYELSRTLSVTVDGEAWTVESVTVANDQSIAAVHSQEITVYAIDVTRYAGGSRTQTAAMISAGAFEKADCVVMASAQNYADALAGAPLAYALKAPILLVSNTPDQATLEEMERLGAKKVYILGGKTAVSEDAEELLAARGYAIERIEGYSRYDTAVAIAEKLEEVTGRKNTEAFFACASNYPDALAVSNVAALKGAPILYVAANGDLKSTAAYLESASITAGTILGGTVAVAAEAEENIKACGVGTVERVFGRSRYDTCLEINKKYAAWLTGPDICVATGTNYPDALAGGVLAANSRSPMLLVAKTLTPAQVTYMETRRTRTVIVFGGELAVSSQVVDEIVAAAR